MNRLILARHGESVFSVAGLLNGDVSVPGGLTRAGVEQARALGAALQDEPIDVVVTSAMERAIATADEAMQGRELPRVVVPELNDPLYGPYEGAEIEEYRAWAVAAPSSLAPGDGGESRYTIVERYATAFRMLLDRPEEIVLAVAHSLPIAYALAAHDGLSPAARMPFSAYATPYPFTREELDQVVSALGVWLAAPSF